MAKFVTLLTDFGDLDPYVGVMRGVIASLAPEAVQFDLTHNIPPGDIQGGALALLQAVPYYPAGTVHLAVVDPGVGSRRRPIAAAVGPALLVGPDNGVFTYLYEMYGVQTVVELADPKYRLSPVSSTFHGRDIFSPAVAHLARGVPLEAFGPPVTDPVRLPLPRLEGHAPSEITGELLHGDRFGNLASSIAWLDWVDETTVAFTPWLPGTGSPKQFDARRAQVTVSPGGASEIKFKGIHRTFSDVAVGEAAIIIGSERHLDVVVNRGNAVQQLNVRPGNPIRIEFPAA